MNYRGIFHLTWRLISQHFCDLYNAFCEYEKKNLFMNFKKPFFFANASFFVCGYFYKTKQKKPWESNENWISESWLFALLSFWLTSIAKYTGKWSIFRNFLLEIDFLLCFLYYETCLGNRLGNFLIIWQKLLFSWELKYVQSSYCFVELIMMVGSAFC